jgi:hypothetical protein
MSKHDSMRLLYIPIFLNLLLFSGHRGSQGYNRKFRGGHKQHVPNAHVRSEIKDLDQVRKERQTKANKISYMKSKSTKGKKFEKFNGNGKRGNEKFNGNGKRGNEKFNGNGKRGKEKFNGNGKRGKGRK